MIKRSELVAAILVTAAVLIDVAQARTIFLSHYSGSTSQRFKGKPSPSVSIDVDRTHNSVHYIGIAYSCSAKAKQQWILRIHPSLKHGSINRKGDFKYHQTSSKSHLTQISAHVTKVKITGQFAATHSCNAKGTYTAKLGGKQGLISGSPPPFAATRVERARHAEAEALLQQAAREHERIDAPFLPARMRISWERSR